MSGQAAEAGVDGPQRRGDAPAQRTAKGADLGARTIERRVQIERAPACGVEASGMMVAFSDQAVALADQAVALAD